MVNNITEIKNVNTNIPGNENNYHGMNESLPYESVKNS